MAAVKYNTKLSVKFILNLFFGKIIFTQNTDGKSLINWTKVYKQIALKGAISFVIDAQCLNWVVPPLPLHLAESSG